MPAVVEPFCYQRRVAFWETDAMGVAHHSNFLKYFEEARVSWLRDKGLIGSHYPFADHILAVIESKCMHYSPARFDDLLEVSLQVRRLRLKIQFQYVIYEVKSKRLVAAGETILVPLNSELKPIRMPKDVANVLERQPWTETWP